MNEQFASEPRFARDEVVVNVDAFGRVDVGAECAREHLDRPRSEGRPIRPCKRERPAEVAQVRRPGWIGDVETSERVPAGRARVMGGNRSTESA